MIEEVDHKDREMWDNLSQHLSLQLRHDIQHTPLGGVMSRLLGEQTELIQSLPVEAAQRVQLLTVRGLANGVRSKEIAQQLKDTGHVTASRAKLIARTEVARTASNLLQARAMECGATHYIWRTMEDSTVRHGHQEMDGKVCEWANAPAVNENGRIMHFHPGCIWNCRCWSEIIINL